MAPLALPSEHNSHNILQLGRSSSGGITDLIVLHKSHQNEHENSNALYSHNYIGKTIRENGLELARIK